MSELKRLTRQEYEERLHRAAPNSPGTDDSDSLRDMMWPARGDKS
jgi:hypothetical protein